MRIKHWVFGAPGRTALVEVPPPPLQTFVLNQLTFECQASLLIYMGNKAALNLIVAKLFILGCNQHISQPTWRLTGTLVQLWPNFGFLHTEAAYSVTLCSLDLETACRTSLSDFGREVTPKLCSASLNQNWDFDKCPVICYRLFSSQSPTCWPLSQATILTPVALPGRKCIVQVCGLVSPSNPSVWLSAPYKFCL